MDPDIFFASPQSIVQKQYEALRAFFNKEGSATEIAKRFGYTTGSFYSLIRDFKNLPSVETKTQFFFTDRKTGRKKMEESGEIKKIVISLRKRYLSVPDIKAVLDVQGYKVSEKHIYNLIKEDGFTRLPRRNISSRQQVVSNITLEAPKSMMLDYIPESFSGQNTLGTLCLLPYIQKFGIDKLIEGSDYPESKSINRLSSIMSFVALKLSNIKRYTTDDAWCMDRGLGLFAGLNVLPKSAWFTSYSHRITRQTNRDFLKKLNEVWKEYGFLSDTSNLDFTTIPYWGDSSHLENNWSGTRNKGMASVCAVLAQEPDSGIITYGDTSIRHNNKSDVVIEFLDFYRSNGIDDLKYLVFDSKFTTYENLSKISKDIKFLTIRRRGKKIVEELNSKPASAWKKIRVPMANGKGRTLKVIDESISLKGYDGEIRQIAITGHGKIKPALLITNDFDKPSKEMIRKYTRRWLVEKGISEQIEFFHLNKISSSMVIKIDFDLTMSILAHNILRLMAMELPGYSHCADNTLYTKFLSMNGTVQIQHDQINVILKKRRHLPVLLTAMAQFQDIPIRILENRLLNITGDTRS